MTSLAYFICIPWSVLSRKDIRPTDKLLYSVLRYIQHEHDDCSPEQGYLAACLGVSVRTVGASIQRLERAGLLRSIRRFKGTSIYIVKRIHDPRYLRITGDIIGMEGVTALQKLILADLGYKSRNDLGRAWPHHSSLADDVGVSQSAVLRAIGGRTVHGKVYQGLEAKRALQIKHRRGGRGRGNHYVVLGGCNAAEMLHDGRKSVAKLPNRKITKQLVDLKVTGARQGILLEALSGRAGIHGTDAARQEAVQRLVQHGVGTRVAESLCRQHPAESIHAAIDNADAWALAESLKQNSRLDRVKRAAYIVGALNTARQEGHIITRSRQYHELRPGNPQRDRNLTLLRLQARSGRAAPTATKEPALRHTASMGRLMDDLQAQLRTAIGKAAERTSHSARWDEVHRQAMAHLNDPAVREGQRRAAG